MTKSDIAELAATKAAPLFRLFGWTYGEKKPTHNELVETIEDLIERCPAEGFASTGRFTVRRTTYDDGDPEISVSLDLYEGPEPDED